MINQSKNLLGETVETDATKETISSPIAIYEKIYNYYFSIQHGEGMNKALRSKERLLGMLSGQNKFVVNNKNEITINRNVEYDTSRLQPVEKNRLEELLQKIKS